MAFSKEEQQSIEAGVAQFAAAIGETNLMRGIVRAPAGAGPFANIVRGVAGPAVPARPAISGDLVASISERHFRRQAETLAFSIPEGEVLQRSGKSLGQCVLAALRRRLCGKEQAKKKVEDALRKAKVADASMLSVGAASIVAAAIGTLFAGPIAVAAAPVLGGLAYLLIASGVDGFCEWEPDEPEEAGEIAKPGPKPKPEPKPKSNPKPKPKPHKEKSKGKRGKR